MESTLNKAKLAVVALCGAITAVFGWLGWLVILFAACMALDWVTGSIAGTKRAGWSSGTARAGLAHKGGMIVIVLVSAACDGLLYLILNSIPALRLPFEYDTLICPLVLCWYIITELGSICENAAALGAPLPGFLRKILAVLKGATETAGDKLAGDDCHDNDPEKNKD